MIRWLLLSVLPNLASAVTGQGPRSIHPINDRYVAVADSSIDAVLIVDGNSGGAVVGHLVLHDRTDDDDPYSWLEPVSLASCDDCKYLFVTSNSALYAIALDRPLSVMAESHDFSALSNSVVREYWPDNWSEKYKGDGYLRMVSIAHDGSSAYVAHAQGGIFSFDPLNPTESSRRAKHVVHVGDADIGQDINGLHHTRSLKNLVITRSKYVHILKLVDEEGENPLDFGNPVAYKLSLDYHCSKLYDGAEMTWMDTAIINEYAFVMGHPKHSDKSEHNGMALYRLTWYDEDERWKDCVQIAGSGLEDAGWVDGSGFEARFSSTPHEIVVLPSLETHTVIVADVDNRALRYVDVTVPVETHDQTDKVRVSSVAYDEDLYQVLYQKEEPWMTLNVEDVMRQDGKSYYHSGPEGLYSMNFAAAQDECGRVGIGRVCTLPEIRARFARGQYPTIDGDDRTWTTVWTAEPCVSCHLEDPGRCAMDGDSDDSWGENFKMIAIFNPQRGLQNQCVHVDRPVDTMSMCCGLGGPAVLSPKAASASEEDGSTDSKKAGVISAGVIVPLFLIAAAAYGLYMRKKSKPGWWPKFLRNDQREETGHAPHREVDMRGRDYI
mmetsp:Transcript_57659/g.122331  ORF Transcript_57659/g.122331 Transcript_57659/m.122331 type:complete len:607 (+) Transcript_57659:238-2058(+)|eukprot:CAMPEP_0172558312 /NCGR_PEP_ID=MMETSP1067-20121228/78481_1 /TAXON_ID=265564 ORGANISM="Thalassiosira punctigera, Strain Tpunct2005C2" /NCGR_SAMPLE_ID=MMETSP1067 /ASSEMBLY_ACC=CAM_ASM_000444 /LENGTH=606 /DNA_ID=CAMNT_0013347643 /DNA_START=196 /DNA_END=2016 /DNA_ORIENTATION=-